MAAGVATTSLRPTDTRARLRAAQEAEKQKRAKGRILRNMPGTKLARSAALGAVPQFNNAQPAETEPQTQTAESTTAREDYQKAFRSRQINHQIGNSVGLDFNRSASNENPSELEQIQQDTAAQEAEMLQNNQQGLDTRSSAAKRAARHAMQKSGLDEGVKAVQNAVQKEIGKLGVNLFGDGVIGVDAVGEDFYTSQVAVFVQRNLQVSRTILSPAPPSIDEMSSVQDIPAQALEKGLDLFIPRLSITSMGGIAGILGFIFQWFVLSLAMILLTVIILLISSAYNLWENPLTSIWAGLRALAGL